MATLGEARFAQFEERLQGIAGIEIFTGRNTPPPAAEKYPYSMVTDGVHGDEIQALKAGRRAKATLLRQLPRGTVIYAEAHLEAIAAGKRQMGHNLNLNRMFRDAAELSSEQVASREYARAQELTVAFDEDSPVTAVLDVHGTSNPVTKPHIICEPHSYPLVARLPIEIVISGFDKIEPGGLDHQANKKGKKGVTVESGYNEDPRSAGTAYETIEAFLIEQNHMDGNNSITPQIYYELFHAQITQTHYSPRRPIPPDFAIVEVGQVLGKDGDQLVRVPDMRELPDYDPSVPHDTEVIVLFGAKEREQGEEAFLLARRIYPDLAAFN